MLTNKLPQLNDDHRAAGWIALGSILYSAGFIYPNERKTHPIATGIARGVILYALTYLYGYFKGMDLTFKSSRTFKWLIIRNILMIFQALCFSWSMYYLPLPIAFTINASSPLFVAILDKIFYGIELNKKQLVWLIFAFMGVILTINGQGLMEILGGYNQSKVSSFENYLSQDPTILAFVAGVFTLSTCGHGLGVVLTKKLGDINSIQINHMQSIKVIIICSILAPSAFADPTYNRITMQEFGWTIFFTGLPTGIGALIYIKGLMLTKNYAVVTPFQFTGIMVGYIVSVIRYNEGVNWICLCGTLAIVIGIVSIMRCKDENQT